MDFLTDAVHASLLSEYNEQQIKAFIGSSLAEGNPKDPNFKKFQIDETVLVITKTNMIILINIEAFKNNFNSFTEINNKYYFYSAKLNIKIPAIINSKLFREHYAEDPQHAKKIKQVIFGTHDEIEDLVPLINKICLASEMPIDEDIKDDDNINKIKTSESGICLIVDKINLLSDLYCTIDFFKELFPSFFAANGKLYFFNNKHKHAINIEVASQLITNLFDVNYCQKIIELSQKHNLTLEQQIKFCIIDNNDNVVYAEETLEKCIDNINMNNNIGIFSITCPLGTTEFGEQFINSIIVRQLTVEDEDE
jgi:hypothetical protein